MAGTKITQLQPAGVPGRRYGSFAGKTATEAGLTVDALIRQLRWQPVWLVTLADLQWVQEDFVQLDMVQRVAAGTQRRFAGYDLDALADPYYGRLLDDPPLQITRETRDAFFGVVTVAEGSFALANADGALTQYAREADLRGTTVTIERYDVISGVFALTVQATVVHVELWPGRLVVHFATEDPSILETEIPRAIVDTARWPKAVDAGATITVGAGVLKKAPLLYVKDDTVGDVYEYLLPSEATGGAWTVDQLYRDGPGEGQFDLIASSEYTVDPTTYAGLTVCRFTTRQTNFANGFHALYADLTGPAVARNFIRVIRSKINNAAWGLDRPVDATSFDAAEVQLDPVTGTAVTGLFCDGLLERPQAAQDVLRELCMVRGIRLGLSAAGAWTVTVDTERTTVALTAQDGLGDGPRTLIAAGPWSRPRVADQVSEYRLHYRRDLVTGEDQHVQSREVHRGLGRPLEESSPWIRDHTTADKVVHYRAQRLIYNSETLPVTLTQEARTLREGDLVRVTYPPLDLVDVDMEVARVTHDLPQAEAALAGWSEKIYDYTAGTLPVDPAPTTTIAAPAAATAIVVRQSGAKLVEIVLTFSEPRAWDHVELWRNTVDNSATATLTEKKKAKIFHDQNVTYGTQYFYWAKVVDPQGNASGFSPSSGHSITVAAIVPEDIATTWPGVRVRHSLGQSGSGGPGTLAFNTEDYDTANMHDTVTNNSRLVAVKAGQYAIFGHAQWEGDSTGRHTLQILKNGTTELAKSSTPGYTAGDDIWQEISVVARLALNDYLELVAGTTGSDEVKSVGSVTPVFSMHWIGP